jgi:hypothetical protein
MEDHALLDLMEAIQGETSGSSMMKLPRKNKINMLFQIANGENITTQKVQKINHPSLIQKFS